MDAQNTNIVTLWLVNVTQVLPCANNIIQLRNGRNTHFLTLSNTHSHIGRNTCESHYSRRPISKLTWISRECGLERVSISFILILWFSQSVEFGLDNIINIISVEVKYIVIVRFFLIMIFLSSSTVFKAYYVSL